MSSTSEELPTRKTVPPRKGAAPSKSAARTSQGNAQTHGYAGKITVLLAAMHVVVSGGARAFLVQSLSATKARTLGLRAHPVDIADEYVRCVTVYAPLIQQKRLPGYGPMRARFGLELVRNAAPALDRYESMNPATRGASALRDNALDLTDALRADAITSLRNLAGDDPMAAERVRAVAEAQPAVDAHLRSMEQIAREIAEARENIPAELLDDAGLTSEVLDAMQSATRDAADARSSSRSQRLAQQSLRAELAEPTGRIVYELQSLLRAARTARRRDRTVPTVTSWLVSRGTTAKVSPAPAPAPAPTPVPSSDPR